MCPKNVPGKCLQLICPKNVSPAYAFEIVAKEIYRNYGLNLLPKMVSKKSVCEIAQISPRAYDRQA